MWSRLPERLWWLEDLRSVSWKHSNHCPQCVSKNPCLTTQMTLVGSPSRKWKEAVSICLFTQGSNMKNEERATTVQFSSNVDRQDEIGQQSHKNIDPILSKAIPRHWCYRNRGSLTTQGVPNLFHNLPWTSLGRSREREVGSLSSRDKHSHIHCFIPFKYYAYRFYIHGRMASGREMQGWSTQLYLPNRAVIPLQTIHVTNASAVWQQL